MLLIKNITEFLLGILVIAFIAIGSQDFYIHFVKTVGIHVQSGGADLYKFSGQLTQKQFDWE